MNDLLHKLNLLVKSSLNDLLGDDSPGSTRRAHVSPDRLGKNIDREITELRKRINEALVYEDELQGRILSLEQEISSFDIQADDALIAGREDLARQAVNSMQSAQKRLAFAQADLREHQIVVQEFMQRVNLLEAVVADARQAQPQTSDAAAAQNEESVRKPLNALSDILRDAREKVGQMEATIHSMRDMSKQDAPTQSISVSTPASEDAAPEVDDDLAKRRQRLSKPD